ncbi:MAG: DNA polymerase Y family protein [Myxococcales bacterium]|nr:DNA polymerase Y family protein [Myxococcales bacterium]
MGRLACVDLPAFPLQLLLRRNPEWNGLPAVVVDDDRPQGVIRWVNRKAREFRILPGQRYAHALSLCGDVRAGVVSTQEVQREIERLVGELRHFSPEVEASLVEPGVFWLDASGLRRLFGSLQSWSDKLLGQLRDEGFVATLIVGFSRFRCYAIARHHPAKLWLVRHRAQEEQLSAAVPLELLDVDSGLRDDLAALGIHQLGQFLRLPEHGVLERFGSGAYQLHRLASGKRWDPLRPLAEELPFAIEIELDDPEANTTGLLFLVKRALDPLLERLARRHRALAVLHLRFELERGEERKRHEEIRPAEATLDPLTLLRLVRLRLESAPPPAAVIQLRVEAEDVAATREQLLLFAQRPKRDLRLAHEALAMLRAEFGNQAVAKPVLRDAHLPEATFALEPFEELKLPRVGHPRPQLVRRIFSRPRELPVQAADVRDDGWLLSGLEQGPVVRVVGPFVISGGWWLGDVHREYHFAETRRGKLLWVFYDRRRRRWFVQGEVQ